MVTNKYRQAFMWRNILREKWVCQFEIIMYNSLTFLYALTTIIHKVRLLLREERTLLSDGIRHVVVMVHGFTFWQQNNM